MLQQLFSLNYWHAILLLVKISIDRKNGNSFLGSIWGLLQPFIHITVISYFMSFILRYDPKIILTNMVGALPFWTFILQSMVQASNSLTAKAETLKRVLLPKTYFPISDILGNVYTLAYSFFAMYIALIITFPDLLSWKIIFIPILSIPLIISVIAGGIVAAFLTPYIRDIPQFINVVLGVLYWTIPIIYPYSLVPESKRIFFEFHPIFIVIKPMQDLVITGNLPDIILIINSWIVCIIITVLSFFIYRKLTKNVIYYL